MSEGTDGHLDAVLPDSAPHLDAPDRAQLHAAYLGNLTWQLACDGTGVDFSSSPTTTNEERA